MSLAIRSARPADSALVFALVRELADYEKLTASVDATPEQIAAALFSPSPKLFCDIAEWNGEPAGFAVWFLNFSTFRGRHGNRPSQPITLFSPMAATSTICIGASPPHGTSFGLRLSSLFGLRRLWLSKSLLLQKGEK